MITPTVATPDLPTCQIGEFRNLEPCELPIRHKLTRDCADAYRSLGFCDSHWYNGRDGIAAITLRYPEDWKFWTYTQYKIRWLSAAETAAIIRAELKRAFPEVKFSVTSNTYSMGASINVRWTEGPTTRTVQAITGRFTGATFNSMEDLKEYHDTVWNGECVHFGADFVFCTRESQEDADDRKAWDANEKARKAARKARRQA